MMMGVTAPVFAFQGEVMVRSWLRVFGMEDEFLTLPTITAHLLSQGA